MTTMQIVALLGGAGLLAAPFVPDAVRWLLASPKPRSSYREAIGHLADVRSRLIATDALHDDQKKAIDVLTLALVDGSDL